MGRQLRSDCSRGTVTGRSASAPGSLRLWLVAAAAVLPLATAGCSFDDPWSFPISRSFYEAVDLSSMADACDPESQCAAAVVLVIPIAIDLLILPVTLPHDLIEHGSLW